MPPSHSSRQIPGTYHVELERGHPQLLDACTVELVSSPWRAAYKTARYGGGGWTSHISDLRLLTLSMTRQRQKAQAQAQA
ncbi:hypothetical protein NPX13_g1600 [Xylaria arbuscula]|uniref:Uncharacterized protein n=1 Tax=Xylaria arbuscula TaxID=114810 RepID=A0A9W8NL52_9PEZI|nr:hypothetical protein NPX13_g1600 [Xylaria arbuscula]